MKHILVLIVLLLVGCDGFLESKSKKSVFVISSYHPEYAWDAAYTKGITDRLSGEYDLSFFSMDTKRLPREEHPKMAAKAVDMVLSKKPDLIIVGDDAALKFTAPRLSRLDIPVVFLGINNNPNNYFSSWPQNFTGVTERPLVHANIMMLNNILPKASRVAVLLDDDLTAKLVKAEFFAGRDNLSIAGTDVDLHMFSTNQEWQTFITSSQHKYDAFIVGLYHTLKDAAGAVVPPDDVLRWTSSTSSVPLFCFWDFSIGPDLAIGGQVVSGEEQGQMAADLVKRIMAGAKPVEIPPLTGGNGKMMFSQAQLTRHGLTLPSTVADTALIVD